MSADRVCRVHTSWVLERLARVEAGECSVAEVRDELEARERRFYAQFPPAPSASYSKRSIVRPDQADPAAWTPMPDGSWRSPRGRRYTAERLIRPLIERRAALGLPTTAGDAS
jgi:hypothetical protein